MSVPSIYARVLSEDETEAEFDHPCELLRELGAEVVDLYFGHASR